MTRRRRELWLALCRLLPGVMTADSFRRHTPRELEDMVGGAIIQRELTRDLLTVHALHVGQFSRRVTFKELAGREPLPVDPREHEGERDAVDPLDDERAARARAMFDEATIRAAMPERVREH